MDLLKGTEDNHQALHNVSMRQGLLQTVVGNGQERRNMRYGRSQAEAPFHHNDLVEGSLGHSPDSLLEGPRLMEALVEAGVSGERVGYETSR